MFASKPSLPQNDTSPRIRAKRLARTREQYQYNHDLLAGCPLIDEVPKAEENSAEYDRLLGKVVAILAENTASSRSAEASKMSVRERAETAWSGGAKGFFDAIAYVKDGKSEAVWPDDLAGYEAQFTTIDLPSSARRIDDDDHFARMRVMGPNPMRLARVDAMPDHFPVTDDHYRAALGDGDSLEAARKDGRLYVVDYAHLDGLECGTHPTDEQKYVQACMALFAVPRGSYPGRPLVSIAIQCGQTPGPETPVLTPRDGLAWRWAKSAFSVADGNDHQAIQHMAYTHMAVQPFAMALNRQLAQSHPLHVLLRPHFEGTIEVNEDAESSLLKPGGGVDTVMSGTIEASRATIGAAYRDLDFDGTTLRQDLANRGVDDSDRLPLYPYRDDALLLWDAIDGWVRDYLALYYPSDADVRADTELQAFMADVVSDDGGRLSSTGQDGGVQTRDYLAGLLTHVIYRAGPLHGVMNFPQWPDMAYAAAYPLAAYRTAPASSAGLTEQDWIRSLPPLEPSRTQINLGVSLGGIFYTQLGRYRLPDRPERAYFSDRRVQEPLAAFQARLEEIEGEIIRRNEVRPTWKWMLPSLVPNCLNI